MIFVADVIPYLTPLFNKTYSHISLRHIPQEELSLDYWFDFILLLLFFYDATGINRQILLKPVYYLNATRACQDVLLTSNFCKLTNDIVIIYVNWTLSFVGLFAEIILKDEFYISMFHWRQIWRKIIGAFINKNWRQACIEIYFIKN